jgi:ABC-type sugar transport system ATPase subunit
LIAGQNPNSTPPLLEMRGISKSYPGVRAVRNVDLQLRRGEVLALLGENGAGKSTLIKILGGAHAPDSGEVLLDGKRLELNSPNASARAGIAVIYQELNLVPQLTPWENIFLGQERGWGRTDRSEERNRTVTLLQQLGQSLDLDICCGDLSIAQQQVVEIAKSLAREARVLVFDEPTAALSPQEVERLLNLIKRLRADGIGIIYISHRLDEIFQIADRILVLRDGEQVANGETQRWTRASLIAAMVGRELDQEYPAREAALGGVRLEVSQLSRMPAVQPCSFTLRRGEILGVTGLVGSGRTELARLLAGADRATGGFVRLDGRELRIRSPREAINAGICLLTEDRKHQGLVLSATVQENFALPNLGHLARAGVIQRNKERTRCREYAERLRIRLDGLDAPAGKLSGGNQQKVVLAKWLERDAEVLIFDEPTRGIDVGAKYEIYLLLNELARQGKSILMISSELPEVLGMSDRILVMHAGRITGEISNPRESTQEQIMQMAVA